MAGGLNIVNIDCIYTGKGVLETCWHSFLRLENCRLGHHLYVSRQSTIYSTGLSQGKTCLITSGPLLNREFQFPFWRSTINRISGRLRQAKQWECCRSVVVYIQSHTSTLRASLTILFHTTLPSGVSKRISPRSTNPYFPYNATDFGVVACR